LNYLLDEQNSKASFIAYAPMHKFKGWVDKGLAGTLEVDTQDFAITDILALAKTCTFDTGDADRNKAMEDFFELKAHTETSFKMTELKSLQALGKNKYKATVLGILDFAGIKRQLPIVCSVENKGERIVFDIAVKWSFKAYGLKAPRLLFLTVRDIVDIGAHLEFIAVQEGI
jgi:polyisoprenoid-binding protein YceI